jgi:2-oxo-hept-3-ene-1,7-dioate hydratase
MKRPASPPGVLNHPANGVAGWRTSWRRTMSSSKPGRLSSAARLRPVPARKGDTFHVDYGNMGAISCRFVWETP